MHRYALSIGVVVLTPLLLVVSSPVPARGAELVVPETAVPVGGLLMVRVDGLAEDQEFSWLVLPEVQTADLLQRDGSPVLFVSTATPGVHSVVLAYVQDGKVVQVAKAVTIGQGPRPPPEPEPEPDDDDPVPTPDVPPGPAGLRVLILEETAERSALEESQLQVLFSPDVRQYLNQKSARGPDGITPEWRLWDDDYSGDQLRYIVEHWHGAYERAKTDSKGVRPWILITTGQEGFSGPLPGNVADTLALLKKYGG